MLLHGEEDALRNAWPHAEECFRTAAFWTIAGQIAERYDAHIVEDNIEAEYMGSPTEIELLVMADSGAEAAVISVQQVSREIRVTEKRLRTQKNPTKGCVKFIRDDDKRFGFIRGESGEEYYFDPRTVGDDDTFSGLREGDSVTFTAGSSGVGAKMYLPKMCGLMRRACA